MRGQSVSIDGPARLQVKTDANGQYKTAGLPPGQYEVKLDIPFATWPSRTQEVDVIERGCARVDFKVDPFQPATDHAAK